MCIDGRDAFHGTRLLSRASATIVLVLATGARAVLPVPVNGGTVGPDSPPSACSMPVVRSSLPAQQVQQLGVHPVGETVEFQVPPNTGTISFIQQVVGSAPQTLLFGTPPSSIPNSAVVTLITAPNGNVLYDDNAAPPADLSTAHAFASGSAGIGVVTLPNTTQAFADSAAGGYAPGRWSVQVNDYAVECLTTASCSGGTNGDRYDLTVLTKPVAGPSGTIDVAIYLATETFTAADAVANLSVARYLQTLAMLFDKASIAIGSVTVYDLPPWAKARYAILDVGDSGPCSDFGQLLAISRPGNTMNFFFVDALQTQTSLGHETIAGLDGAIPGPTSMGGTVVGGAVVSAADLFRGTCRSIHFGKCGADIVAYISAHEAGHFLGLYHTTESAGSQFDPLADTPQCVCGTACVGASSADLCSSGTFHISNATCNQRRKAQCAGGDNLMFWALDSNVSTGVVTVEQGKVMRASPAVR